MLRFKMNDEVTRKFVFGVTDERIIFWNILIFSYYSVIVDVGFIDIVFVTDIQQR